MCGKIRSERASLSKYLTLVVADEPHSVYSTI
jgi:hypothetical protein